MSSLPIGRAFYHRSALENGFDGSQQAFDVVARDVAHGGDAKHLGFEPALPGIYKVGVQNNIATFYDSIVKGVADNPTVAPSVRSNLVTVLGRLAADRGGEVTWSEMIQKSEKIEYDLAGLKA